MTSAILALLASLLGTCPPPGTAPAPPPVPTRPGDPSSRPAKAGKDLGTALLPALAQFLATIDETDFDDMGFEDMREIPRARLGIGMRKHSVSREALAAWTPAQDPCSLVGDDGLADYFVTVDGKVRSFLTLERRGAKWTGLAYGAPVSARAVWSVYEPLLAGQAPPWHGPPPPTDPAEYFHLSLRGLNYTFMAYLQGSRLVLVPIQDIAAHGLPRGRPVLAEAVFTALRPVAHGQRGQPG